MQGGGGAGYDISFAASSAASAALKNQQSVTDNSVNTVAQPGASQTTNSIWPTVLLIGGAVLGLLAFLKGNS